MTNRIARKAPARKPAAGKAGPPRTATARVARSRAGPGTDRGTDPGDDKGAGERRPWTRQKRVAHFAGDWNIGFQVRDLHRLCRNNLKGRIAKHGVTVGMWSYLWTLYQEDGLSQNELARRVKIVGPSAVAAINLMERRGLVQRVRNTDDRRVVNIFLTAKAKAMRGAMIHQAANVSEYALRLMTNAQLAQMFKLLALVRRGLEGK